MLNTRSTNTNIRGTNKISLGKLMTRREKEEEKRKRCPSTSEIRPIHTRRIPKRDQFIRERNVTGLKHMADPTIVGGMVTGSMTGRGVGRIMRVLPGNIFRGRHKATPIENAGDEEGRWRSKGEGRSQLCALPGSNSLRCYIVARRKPELGECV